jgi:hypothetical protein
MFVPNLSWKIIILMYKWLKKPVFSPGGLGCSHRLELLPVQRLVRVHQLPCGKHRGVGAGVPAQTIFSFS